MDEIIQELIIVPIILLALAAITEYAKNREWDVFVQANRSEMIIAGVLIVILYYQVKLLLLVLNSANLQECSINTIGISIAGISAILLLVGLVYFVTYFLSRESDSKDKISIELLISLVTLTGSLVLLGTLFYVPLC